VKCTDFTINIKWNVDVGHSYVNFVSSFDLLKYWLSENDLAGVNRVDRQFV
jgi:hypothetical protein